MSGLFAALWKLGVLDSIGSTWTVIGDRDRDRLGHHDRGHGQRREEDDRGRSQLTGGAARPGPSPPSATGRSARRTVALAAPLSAEDQVVQSMPDASPTKWHLAHTTWFFETFVLAPLEPAHRPFDPRYAYLFNSYYEAVGPRQPRPQPRAPDAAVARRGARLPRRGRRRAWTRLLGGDAAAGGAGPRRARPAPRAAAPGADPHRPEARAVVQPAAPRVRAGAAAAARRPTAPPAWIARTPRACVEIGHAGDGFAFDNEGPRHRVFLEAFELAAGR